MSLNETTVYEWHKHFCEDHTNIKDDPWTGHQSFCTANENVERIREIMHADRWIIVGVITYHLGVFIAGLEISGC